VNFAAINLCIASQRVFVLCYAHVIDSVRKLLGTPSYVISAQNDLSEKWNSGFEFLQKFWCTLLQDIWIHTFSKSLKFFLAWARPLTG